MMLLVYLLGYLLVYFDWIVLFVYLVLSCAFVWLLWGLRFPLLIWVYSVCVMD